MHACEGLNVACKIKLGLHINASPYIGNEIGLVLIVVDVDINTVVGLVALPVRSQLEHYLVKLAIAKVHGAIVDDDTLTSPSPRAIVDASIFAVRIDKG